MAVWTAPILGDLATLPGIAGPQAGWSGKKMFSALLATFALSSQFWGRVQTSLL